MSSKDRIRAVNQQFQTIDRLMKETNDSINKEERKKGNIAEYLGGGIVVLTVGYFLLAGCVATLNKINSSGHHRSHQTTQRIYSNSSSGIDRSSNRADYQRSSSNKKDKRNYSKDGTSLDDLARQGTIKQYEVQVSNRSLKNMRDTNNISLNDPTISYAVDRQNRVIYVTLEPIIKGKVYHAPPLKPLRAR